MEISCCIPFDAIFVVVFFLHTLPGNEKRPETRNDFFTELGDPKRNGEDRLCERAEVGVRIDVRDPFHRTLHTNKGRRVSR